MPGFQLRVKQYAGFLRAVLEHFPEGAALSLEGDLCAVDFARVPGAAWEPTEVLRRHTRAPLQQFVVIPVAPATVELVYRRVLLQVGLKSRLRHVQVAAGDRLVFGAYDMWQHVWLDEAVGSETMAAMRSAGLIGWYARQEPSEPPRVA